MMYNCLQCINKCCMGTRIFCKSIQMHRWLEGRQDSKFYYLTQSMALFCCRSRCRSARMARSNSNRRINLSSCCKSGSSYHQCKLGTVMGMHRNDIWQCCGRFYQGNSQCIHLWHYNHSMADTQAITHTRLSQYLSNSLESTESHIYHSKRNYLAHNPCRMYRMHMRYITRGIVYRTYHCRCYSTGQDRSLHTFQQAGMRSMAICTVLHRCLCYPWHTSAGCRVRDWHQGSSTRTSMSSCLHMSQSGTILRKSLCCYLRRDSPKMGICSHTCQSRGLHTVGMGRQPYTLYWEYPRSSHSCIELHTYYCIARPTCQKGIH